MSYSTVLKSPQQSSVSAPTRSVVSDLNMSETSSNEDIMQRNQAESTHAIAIVGSRGFKGDKAYALLCNTLRKFNPTRIVSGGAEGADTLGATYAKEHGITLDVFVPQWKAWRLKHGYTSKTNRAGFERNTDIISASDIVIAFWDGKSEGTKDSINKARKLKKTLVIIRYDTSDIA
jgi:hypothetical protein